MKAAKVSTGNEEARLEFAGLLTAIAAKRERLDGLRPLSRQALSNLEHYYDIELTYASNGIEGNTLSAVETTLAFIQLGDSKRRGDPKRSLLPDLLPESSRLPR